MNRLLCFCSMVITICLFSCHKSIQTPQYPSFYGQWQYIGYEVGPGFHAPSPDSTVVLTLSTGNNYGTTLNGKQVMSGTFSIDTSSNRVYLKFNNITQPAGNTTSAVSGNLTFLYFNFSKIGQLTLFENNWTSSPGDTLYLIQSPTIPESTTNYFKRIQSALK